MDTSKVSKRRGKGKKAPDPSLYTASEAAARIGIPPSTFQNYVRAKEIKRIIPDGKREGYYNKAEVDAFADKYQKRGRSRRSRSTEQTRLVASEAATDWIHYEDEINAYNLDCLLYGFENSVSPDVTWTWWQKNPHACRILYNKNDRNDLWGLISVIPMNEDIIYKLFQEEMSEKDIRPEHVLVYETGKHYSCYVAAISMRPEHRHSFPKLLGSMMDFWLEHADIYIDKLFAFALGADGMRLIRKLYFWPRRDISVNAWELDLTVYNPSPAVKNFQLSIQAVREGKKKKKDFPYRSLAPIGEANTELVPVSLEKSTTSDIPFVVEISRTIYGSAGTPLKRRQEWLEKNPDYLYVARDVNKNIIGYASIMPLTEELIRQILNEQINPGDITAEQLQVFMLGSSIDIYIASVAVIPDLPKEVEIRCGFELIKGLMDLFVNLGHQGILIRNIYARSRTVDGIRTLTRIGFTEIESLSKIGQRHFVIDVEKSGLHFIRQYKEALRGRNKI